jgi:DNA-nicking Smr family endonuclease
MAKRSNSGGDDASFADMVGRVRRITHDTVEPQHPRPPPRRAIPAPDSDDDVADLDTYSDTEHGDDADEYQRNGVQHSVMRKLRRGDFSVEDELDLHGLTVLQARRQLSHFLDHARGQRLSCVRIVHGKGLSSPGLKAVLRPRVRHWLRHDERVLAFTPAAANDGGSGALYALLRSRSN